MRPLTGWRFAICGPRRAAEIALILDKQGAKGFSHPTVKTVLADSTVLKSQLEKFCLEGADWVIVTTGVGINELKTQAEQFGLWGEVFARLKEANLAIRGYKSDKAISKILLEPDITDSDGSVDSLIQNLSQEDFSGKKVFLQLYGQASPKLVKFLQDRGASVEELLPYQNVSVSNDELDSFIGKILALEFDAIIFTSVPQVEYLLSRAIEIGKLKELKQVFQNIWALAVGHVTAKPLEDAGIREWHPQVERMGAMITEFSQMVKDA